MRVTRRRVLVSSGIGVGLAGCLGDDGPAESGTGAETGTQTNDADVEVTVRVRSHPELGPVLVDSEGMTLYYFDADDRGEETSACYDDCAGAWPPLTVDDEPTAGDGVTADLTAFERADGTTQVAANGWPLYEFSSDDEPGDVTGQGVNDVWWVLSADGTPVRDVDDDDDEDVDDGDDDGADDADATVTVAPGGSFAFDPDRLEVEVGDSVEFVWEGDHHNVAVVEQPVGGTWEGVSETQNAGHTHRHTFDVAGEYVYVCEPHEGAGMTGIVVVEAESMGEDAGGGYEYEY